MPQFYLRNVDVITTLYLTSAVFTVMEPSELIEQVAVEYRPHVKIAEGPVENSGLVTISGLPSRDLLIDVGQVSYRYLRRRFHIWDYTASNLSAITAAEIKYIAERQSAFKTQHDPAVPGIILLHVMGNPSNYGLMRMYQSWSEVSQSKAPMFAVKNLQDAVAKIGILAPAGI